MMLRRMLGCWFRGGTILPRGARRERGGGTMPRGNHACRYGLSYASPAVNGRRAKQRGYSPYVSMGSLGSYCTLSSSNLNCLADASDSPP